MALTTMTKELALRGISYLRSDDLERARLRFKNFTPEQMQQQWGASGNTCAQILADYERHAAACETAAEEIKSA